ncbi:ECF RNA polymerase sigma factor SigK [Haloferula sargassicola]|uniref:ECF RNA polymerase sigma factor SigK n=2 Tax=Haloferula sargassicola TaxID=490096 RepID=A0ABP9UK31_9BACT
MRKGEDMPESACHSSTDPPSLLWDGTWLLERIAGGDGNALEQLYRMWGDRLFSMAAHLLGDEGAADEALQDCFLRIWKKAGEYDPARSRGFTWAGMILRGICLDMLRKRRRRAPVWADESAIPELGVPASHGGVEDLLFRDTVRRVESALRGLSEDEAGIVRTALFDPATIDEQAVRWKVPVATAKTRLFRAMKKLRKLMENPKGGTP